MLCPNCKHLPSEELSDDYDDELEQFKKLVMASNYSMRISDMYALLMRANKPETTVQSSASFFSWHHMVYFSCEVRLPDEKRVPKMVHFVLEII